MNKRVVGLSDAALPADLELQLQQALVRTRADFICDPGVHYTGTRFFDDQTVIRAIAGTYTPEEVRTDPSSAAAAGLIWAAEVDYHYAFEKEYD